MAESRSRSVPSAAPKIAASNLPGTSQVRSRAGSSCPVIDHSELWQGMQSRFRPNACRSKISARFRCSSRALSASAGAESFANQANS